MRADAAEADLRRALDAAPAPVRLWWRDDDAGRDDPRLDALLRLARRRAAPLALAVVPDWLEPACVARILDSPWPDVLQHGIAHANHARPGGKKIELGGTLAVEGIGPTLVAMGARLRRAFAGRALPVLVPPWNRIDAGLVARLPELGYAGLSTFGPLSERHRGLVQVNTHLDLIAWRAGGRPLGFAAAASGLAGLVGSAMDEPLGILSHHLAMDEGAFAALDRLLAIVQDHPRARLGTIRGLIDDEEV